MSSPCRADTGRTYMTYIVEGTGHNTSHWLVTRQRMTYRVEGTLAAFLFRGG